MVTNRICKKTTLDLGWWIVCFNAPAQCMGQVRHWQTTNCKTATLETLGKMTTAMFQWSNVLWASFLFIIIFVCLLFSKCISTKRAGLQVKYFMCIQINNNNNKWSFYGTNPTKVVLLTLYTRVKSGVWDKSTCNLIQRRLPNANGGTSKDVP